MSLRALCIVGLLLVCGTLHAQQPAPTAASLAEAAARRFPQPVKVGDLLRREVLWPLESQPSVGTVRSVVKQPDGSIAVVLNYGGLFGLFTRPIAVPVDAMTLLGQHMQVVGFSPDQLKQFTTFNDPAAMPLPPDSIIRIGLARPAH